MRRVCPHCGKPYCEEDVYGSNVKLGYEKGNAIYKDRWYIAEKVRMFMPENHTNTNCTEKYVSIYNSFSKTGAIEAIPNIIRDLQALYDQCKV